MMNIEGQVVVVTGGSKGLGRSIVRVMGSERCRVVAVARNERELQDVVERARSAGENVVGVAADIGGEEGVRTIMETARHCFGEPDILINNAGCAYFEPVEDLSVNAFEEMVHTNLKGMFLCTKEVVPAMKRRRSGQIIIVSSAAGIRGQRDQAIYSATKFAQVGFAQSLDQELREYGIRVGVLNPGSINTHLWESVSGKPDRRGEWVQWGKAAMDADDVAEAVRLMVKQNRDVRILQMVMRPMMEAFE